MPVFLPLLPAVFLWLWDVTLRPGLTVGQNLAVFVYLAAISLLAQHIIKLATPILGQLVLVLASLWLGLSTYFNSEYFTVYASFISPEELRVILKNVEYWTTASEVDHLETSARIIASALVVYSLFLIALRFYSRTRARWLPWLCASSLLFLFQFDAQWHPSDLSFARSTYLETENFFAERKAPEQRSRRTRPEAEVLLSNNEGHLPNIVIIITESLRADHLPHYGYNRETLPLFKANFPQTLKYKAIASATVTSPAVEGILTGQHSSPLSFGDNPLAWDFFKKLGYQTWLFSSHWYEWQNWGFERRVIDYRFIDKISWPRQEARRDSETVDRFIRSTAKITDQPLFAVLHLRDQHFVPKVDAPHRNFFRPSYGTRDPEEISALINLYDNSILSLDANLERVYAALGQEFWNDTVVVFTSDHGDAFYEHGMAFHTTAMWQEVLEVPLIISLPASLGLSGQQKKHLRSNQDHWVSNTSILPTLLDVIGAKTKNEFDGTSLAAKIESGNCVLTLTSAANYTVIFRETGEKIWIDNNTLKMRISNLKSDLSEHNTVTIELDKPVFLDQLIDRLKSANLSENERLDPVATACISEVTARLGSHVRGKWKYAVSAAAP